jgi:hypothetical protein
MATRKNRGSRRGRGTRKGGSWRMSNGKWKKNTPELKSIHADLVVTKPKSNRSYKRNSAPGSNQYAEEVFFKSPKKLQAVMNRGSSQMLSPFSKFGVKRRSPNYIPPENTRWEK